MHYSYTTPQDMDARMRRNSSASLFLSTEGRTKPSLARQASRGDDTNNSETTEGSSHFRRLLQFIYPSQKRRCSFSSFIRPTVKQQRQRQEDDNDSLVTIDDQDDILGVSDSEDSIEIKENDAKHTYYRSPISFNVQRRRSNEELDKVDFILRKRSSHNRRAMYLPNDPIMNASDGPKDEWHAWRLYCSTYQKLLLHQTSIPLSKHLLLKKMLVTLQQKNLDLFSRSIQGPSTKESIFDIVKYDCNVEEEKQEEDSCSDDDSDVDSDNDDDEALEDDDLPLDRLLYQQANQISKPLEYTEHRAGNDDYDIKKALYSHSPSILLSNIVVQPHPVCKPNKSNRKSILQIPIHSSCYQHKHNYCHRSAPVVRFI
ncbi:hypothetical protein BDF20DRAFT_835588 [Mycotypha africana]|uniref:uncharacterized protein n=1 Tax=Mycotypha africana TaxID=64632 RepID=UPI002301EC1B|nr:uncharacterized protein BDF20DRAFT_835588 [Mycotypha africana]KAI8979584.1 hypothetical protein BDF20DRAFT_835588 [Mycotypha africana]